MKQDLDFYTKIQDLVRKEAEQVATQVYNKLGTKYNVAQVPTHTHNGIDSVQIPYKNIIQGQKYTSGLIVYDDAFAPLTATFTIGGIFNPTRIVFAGFAANNADGTPATKRAIINGEINFGTCLEFSDMTPPIVVSTSGAGKPFLQFCNSMYIDSSDLTKNRVIATEGAGDSATAYFILSNDDAAAVFASVQATDYNNQTGILTIDVVLAANVKLQGALTIT
jgi:hypothetical protein